MRIGEELIKLVEMEVDQVAKFGPVDVSLMEIARRHHDDSPLILTVDGQLQSKCASAGINTSRLIEVAS
jgi:hypothetical protein